MSDKTEGEPDGDTSLEQREYVNIAGVEKKNGNSIILKSAVSLFVADAATKGANVIIALLIARYLGPLLFGKYAIASSVCGLFMMITGIGFEQEFTRRGGIDKTAIPQSLMLNHVAIAITSIMAYLGMFIFFSFGIYSKDVVIVGLLLGAALVVMRFHLPFRHLCLLLNKSNITAAIQSVSTALIVVLTLVIIYFKGSLNLIVSSQFVVATGIIVLWIWWVPKKYLSFYPDAGAIIAFFKKSIPFAISNILWIAYFNFDTFMLSLMRTEGEVGIYAGVYRIIGINYIIGYAIANSFTPRLFKKFATGNPEYYKESQRLTRTLSLVGAVLCFGLYYFADILIPGIVGKEYTAGVRIAEILSLAVFFRMVNFGLCEILTTSNRQKIRIYLEMFMLLVNIILNYILIPQYGGMGAAIATVIAEAVLFLGAFICFRMKKVVSLA